MKLDIIFSTIVLIILIVMTVVSIGYPPKARLFPLILIAITEAMVAIHIINEIRGRIKKHQASEAGQGAEKVPLSRYFRAPVWIGCFMIALYLFGHLVGVALFSFLYLKVHGEKWLTTIGFSLGVMALIYGGFEIALQTQLYEGILFR